MSGEHEQLGGGIADGHERRLDLHVGGIIYVFVFNGVNVVQDLVHMQYRISINMSVTNHYNPLGTNAASNRGYTVRRVTVACQSATKSPIFKHSS